jgi:microcystin degradation protein MlrC
VIVLVLLSEPESWYRWGDEIDVDAMIVVNKNEEQVYGVAGENITGSLHSRNRGDRAGLLSKDSRTDVVVQSKRKQRYGGRSC